MSKDQTTLSIDKITKNKAEIMAKKMHLTLSGVTRILLNDFADGKIQIATIMVNKDENGLTELDKKELRAALKDVKEGKNIEGPFNTAEEFIKSLK
jgi:antitoxin component of RelBE/YafQ-DinJ toxin-antitoxin module